MHTIDMGVKYILVIAVKYPKFGKTTGEDYIIGALYFNTKVLLRLKFVTKL